MLEQKGVYAVLKNNLSLLEGLEFTPPSSARTKGDTRYIRTWYVYQHFLFDFPFDEIYTYTFSFFHSRAFFLRVSRLFYKKFKTSAVSTTVNG